MMTKTVMSGRVHGAGRGGAWWRDRWSLSLEMGREESGALKGAPSLLAWEPLRAPRNASDSSLRMWQVTCYHAMASPSPGWSLFMEVKPKSPRGRGRRAEWGRNIIQYDFLQN